MVKLVAAGVVLTVTPVSNFAKAEPMRRSLDVTLLLIWCVRVITAMVTDLAESRYRGLP